MMVGKPRFMDAAAGHDQVVPRLQVDLGGIGAIRFPAARLLELDALGTAVENFVMEWINRAERKIIVLGNEWPCRSKPRTMACPSAPSTSTANSPVVQIPTPQLSPYFLASLAICSGSVVACRGNFLIADLAAIFRIEWSEREYAVSTLRPKGS